MAKTTVGKKKPHMTLEEFLVELKKACKKKSYTFKISQHAKAIRENKHGYCPLTAVAFSLGHTGIGRLEHQSAAKLLGVRPTTANKIADAADLQVGFKKRVHYAKLRRRLFDALGLPLEAL